MIIGVDVSPAAKAKKTGVEWYVYHAAKSLMQMDRENHYRFYTKTSLKNEFSYPSNFEEVLLPEKKFWTHTALALELLKNPVDVFYSPGHIIPWWSAKRTVTTIHDAGFRHYKNNYSKYQFFHATLNTYTSAKWSDDIIVPSQFVADDIDDYYHLSNKNIVVIPNGFDPSEFKDLSAGEVSEVSGKYKIDNPYFVFVGRMEVRKNIVRSLEAFFNLVDRTGKDLNFVLIGSAAVGSDEIEELIKSHKKSHLVIRPGYVSSREKAVLLHGAIALVFPSLYEGFGIPILEGFAAGVPVITSNITSCPEVAGDAALIVDPYDTEQITSAMMSLLTDETVRADLVTKGYQRAKLYSWDIMTRQIHGLLTKQA